MFAAHKSLIAGLILAFTLQPARAENLLIITIDTLRADRLGCYGYGLARTPNLDRIAAGGVLFERAFAEIPLTLPSHSSIFTGTLPVFHGVRDNAGFVLPDSSLTLAEVLRDRGYSTGAFIGAYVVSARFGLAQGFGEYEESFQRPAGIISGSAVRRSSEAVAGPFLDWLESHHEQPFFAWVHFYDPHPPWDRDYDSAIAGVDRTIGRIDQELLRLGLQSKTHLIVAGDHGESLGEHGESGHGYFVYDATLRVPLIIRPANSFRAKAKRVATSVALIDLMPTALQFLGIPIGPEVQGRSLIRLMMGRRESERSLYAESYLPQLQFGWARLRSLRRGRYKLIEAPQPEFYDLESDPDETTNIFRERASLASSYQQMLNEQVSKYTAPEGSVVSSSAIDAEQMERLAALGYASISTGRPMVEDTEGGADPKDKIEVFEEYTRLVSGLRRNSQDTLERIRSLRRKDPELRGLHYIEAVAEERLGRFVQARDSYLAALKENEANNAARANLANIYLRLQDPGSAEETFVEVLRRDPNDYRARNNLAMLRFQLRADAAGTIAELERVVREAPSYAQGWFSLGVVLAESGDLVEAEKSLSRAVDLNPDNERASALLSRIRGKKQNH